MKRYQVPVGIGAHRFEPIAFCVREGLVPDFYFKTLHHDRYWSAHPPENRRDLEITNRIRTITATTTTTCSAIVPKRLWR